MIVIIELQPPVLIYLNTNYELLLSYELYLKITSPPPTRGIDIIHQSNSIATEKRKKDKVDSAIVQVILMEMKFMIIRFLSVSRPFE